MHPVNPLSQREEVVLYLQRNFRHRRYLKRAEDKGAPYIQKLYVHELERSQFRSLKKVVDQWKSQCKSEIAYLYHDVSEKLNHWNERFIVAFDLQGNPQGVAVINDCYGQEIWMNYLVTNPSNLKEEPKIKGVGTALIEKVIHIASQSEKLPTLIGLWSTLQSKPFYKKLLFVESVPVPGLFLLYRKTRNAFMNQLSGRASALPYQDLETKKITPKK